MKTVFKRYRLLICLSASMLILLFVFCIAVNRRVIFGAMRGDIFPCEGEKAVETQYDAIVVLGAGLQSDGSPSQMLEDRLRAAVALYGEGISESIILSGDRSGDSYDEVGAMERYCLNAGVPQEAIVRDDRGFSTYETMYNTAELIGAGDIIVITQEYHLYRAIYIARSMGIEADGLCADYRTYRAQFLRDIREYAARIKDFLAVNIFDSN